MHLPTEKPKVHIFSYLLLIIFGISLLRLISKVPFYPDFLEWIILGIHFIIVGTILSRISSRNSKLVKQITAALCIISIYFALGSGILHYQGEGGTDPSTLGPATGNVDYYLDLHNGLGLPITIVKVLPIGYKDLTLTTISLKNQGVDNNLLANMNFTVSGPNPKLPKQAIVVYRTMGIIPMINFSKFELTIKK